MVEQMGRAPKADIKVFSHTFGMSERYKAILGALDMFHAQTDTLAVPADRTARAEARRSIEAALTTVDDTARAYLAKHNEPRETRAVQALQQQIADVRNNLSILSDDSIQWDRANGGRPMSMTQLIELSRFGLRPGPDMVFNPAHIDANLPNARAVTLSGQVNTVEKVTYANGDTRILKAESATRGAAQIEAPMQIPERNPCYAARNIATQVVDDVLHTALVPQTSLAMHNGKLNVAMAWAPGVSGGGKTLVVPLDPKRDEALIDKLRGLGEGTPAFKQLASDIGLTEAPGKTGLAALGRAVHQPYDIDFAAPALMRSMNNLEWLDMITGQGDRHDGNYIIESHTDGRFKGLKAIDNDASFGKAWTDMGAVKDAQRQRGNHAYQTFHGVGLPLVVDKGLAETLQDPRTWPAMKARLDQLLSPEEVAATKARFDQALTHIRSLPPSHVITDWGTARIAGTEPKTGEAFEVSVAQFLLARPQASYVGRAAEPQTEARRFNQPLVPLR